MKRFFSKKSVAIILAAFVLIGAMSFGFVSTAVAAGEVKTIGPVNVKIPLKNAWFSNSTVVPATAIAQYQLADSSGVSGFFIIEVAVKYPGDNSTTTIRYNYQGSLGSEYLDSWTKEGDNSNLLSTDNIKSMFPELMSQPDILSNVYNTRGKADLKTNNAKIEAEKAAAGDILSKVGEDLLNAISGVASFPIFAAWALTLGAVNILVAVFTALSGLIFDKSIEFSILNISTLFGDNGPVNVLWVLVRDLTNVTFIFILLYTAISKILTGWGLKEKTTIIKIILAAIVINFSMVITKVLIDAGNYIAVALYDGIRHYSMVTSLSGLILKGTGIMTFINSLYSIKAQTNVVVSLIFQIVAMGILAWTYFYTSILLIGRAVMLLFLTIISPIAFVGDIMPIPQIKSVGDWWWKTLVEQIFLAPVLMFFR